MKKKREVQGNTTKLNIMQFVSLMENKGWIKLLKYCRCRLNPWTCLTGFRDKAFCFVGFFINSITNKATPGWQKQKWQPRRQFHIQLWMMCLFIVHAGRNVFPFFVKTNQIMSNKWLLKCVKKISYCSLLYTYVYCWSLKSYYRKIIIKIIIPTPKEMQNKNTLSKSFVVSFSMTREFTTFLHLMDHVELK